MTPLKENFKVLITDPKEMEGEGNDNPLQCSCLKNPRDGGAWWAAICGVAQSRTRLKRLSSSSKEMEIYGLVRQKIQNSPVKEF